jgi:hypothetical protein
MNDSAFHVNLAREKRQGALRELSFRAYSNVADLALKAVEQAIEAAEAKRDIHFHVRPRTAHMERRKWISQNFPQVVEFLKIVWDAYGRLGYGGVDGERARKAIEAMEAALNEIGKAIGTRFV